MKNHFPGYFRPSNQDFEHLWQSAIIVLDASILSGFYRYSDTTRKEFLSVLNTFGDRLWLPHRAAEEFFRNRISVIAQQARAYDETVQRIESLQKALENKRQHPFISPRLLQKLVKDFKEADAELRANAKAHRCRITEDSILKEVARLFQGRLGPATRGDDLQKLCAEGKQRYAQSIPPGYKDSAKDSAGDPSRPYGDLILWREILDKAKKDQKAIIIVLDDRKEDWWLIHDGQTLSPRPELIKEFMDYSGKPCYMYQPDAFLSHSIKYTKQQVSGLTIHEVEDFRDQQTKLVQEALAGQVEATRAYLAIVNDPAMRNLWQQIQRDVEMATRLTEGFPELKALANQTSHPSPGGLAITAPIDPTRVVEASAQMLYETTQGKPSQ
jgi:hypothetical protein